MTRRAGRPAAGVLAGLAGAGLLLGPVAGAAAGAAAGASTAAAAEETQQCEIGVTRYVRNRNLNVAPKLIGTFSSWRYGTGRGITVAVVDSGVNTQNAHLSDNVARGVSFAGGEPDGRSDESGHGTAVAGIIAAQPVQGSALVGQAYEATILPVRVFQRSTSEDDPAGPPQFPPTAGRVAQGIRWAVDNGADVINVSMTSDRSDEAGWRAQRTAVRYAARQDVLVVAATGDANGEAPVTQTYYPAGFPGVLGVAAANPAAVVDDFSVHGEAVDVAAPGGNILVAFHGNGDCIAGQDGPLTSWAAGYVSGLAAQLRERFPDEDAATIAYRIQASARRSRSDQRDDLAGWGLIRSTEALTMAIDPNAPGPPVPGEARPKAAAPESTIAPITEAVDPLAGPRRSLLWWGLGGTGLAALVLLLRPLLRRRAGV